MDSTDALAGLGVPAQPPGINADDSQAMEEGQEHLTDSVSQLGDDPPPPAVPQRQCLVTDDDSNWKLQLSRRQRRKQRKAQQAWVEDGRDAGRSGPSTPRSDAAMAGAHTDNKTRSPLTAGMNDNANGRKAQRGLRRKLPPLPKEDIKIIMRPKKGLAVKTLSTHQVSRAIVEACGHSQDCRDVDFILRLRNGSNIIIVSTPHEHTAALLRRITHLKIEGLGYDMNTYVAAPEDMLRGVIHGIDPGTSTEELLNHLRVRTQGVTVQHARMLGKSKTAVITFDGPLVPRYVLYYGGEVACYPYRPTRQVCHVCMQQGHRSDVCPTPDAKACRQCGILDPLDNHTCTPKCGLCGEAHITGARECPNRLKALRKRPTRQGAGKSNQTRGRSRSAQRSQKRQRKRWFSTDGDTSTSRSRSRSQSYPALAPAGRQQQTQHQQPPQKNQGKKKQKKSTQGGGNSSKVSWPVQVASNIAPHNSEHHKLQTENQALRSELELLRVKQGQQEREIAELRALVRDFKKAKEEMAMPPVTATTAADNYVTMKTFQDMLQQMANQITQQFTAQINEVKSSIRKHLTGSNVRDKVERVYNRPGLAAMTNGKNTPGASTYSQD